MNVSLKFLPQLTGLVRAELEQLTAAIRTGWLKEHTLEGTHQGASGSFTTVDSKTVTVVNGVITNIA
jgi:hypothetical protein